MYIEYESQRTLGSVRQCNGKQKELWKKLKNKIQLWKLSATY